MIGGWRSGRGVAMSPLVLSRCRYRCLVTALAPSSGLDALWEVIGAGTNVPWHLSVLSSDHEYAATEYLHINAKNTPSDAPKNFYDTPIAA